MIFRLDRAFKAFFRRCKAGENPGYPRFRTISRMETIDLVDPRATMVKKRKRGYAIRPKGFPTIRLFPSTRLPAGCPLKVLRIVRKPNRVYVDLVYEVEKEPLPACQSAVGIDLGVRKRAVLSIGELIERNTRDWPGIRRQQRKVARCKRGSNCRKKRGRQLARLRYREKVRNRNACHQNCRECQPLFIVPIPIFSSTLTAPFFPVWSLGIHSRSEFHGSRHSSRFYWD